MEFSEKIRRLLKAHRLSQADLARSLGTNQQQVSRWLEAKTPPKAAYLLKLARALGVTADYLIDDAQDEPAPGPGLHPDEVYLVRVVRGIGLDFEEAIARLWGAEPGGEAREGGVGRTRAHRDLSEVEREKRRRSGLEPDPEHGQVADGKGGGPGPGGP